MGFLAVLSSLPLFFYLLDGYYENNPLKGVLHILLFLIFAISATFIIEIYPMQFALSIPFLVFLYVGMITIFKKSDSAD